MCEKIIRDKVNKDNVAQAIKIFTTFFGLKEENKNECYRKVEQILHQI